MDDVLKESISAVDLTETSRGLLSVPPGFSRGLRFPGDEVEEEDLIPTLTSAPRHTNEQIVSP